MTRFTRKVVAMALAATMLFSTMVTTAFANNNQSTYEESANILKGYGVLVGDNGNLMLDQQLKRQDAVVISLRLMGKADAEFENYDKVSDFTDIADEYYMPVIGMAQDLGLIEGMGDGTFGFDQKITAQQLQTILLRALGYEITDEIYANVPQMAEELGITNLVTAEAGEQINRALVAQMMLNALNTNVKDGEQKLGEVLGLFQNEVSPLEMTAAMLNDSAVKVTFNRAVADTSKLSFELKGTTTVETQVAWNDAKTEATLTAPSTILEGSYTVKATGDTFAEGKNVANLVVVKNGIAKIEFLSDKLVKDSTNLLPTLRYKVLDKYGVDITKTTTESDLSVAASRTLNGGNPFDIDAEKGIMTLRLAGALTDTDKTVAVTIIATKSGAAQSATLNVADEAKVDLATLKAVEFPKTTPVTTKVLVNKATAAYITLEAKDQYGNVILDDAKLNSDVLVVKSDSALVLTAEEYTNANDVDGLRLVVDTTGITTAKTVTVSLVSKLSGKSTSISLDIKEAAKADKVTLGNQTAIAAEGDASGKFVLPMTVIDQYGVQLTADEIVSNAGNITINASGALAGDVAIATTGENKGKIVNTAAMPAEGTYVITVSTSTGSVATYTLEVKEAAYEKTIKVDVQPAQNLLMGAVTKMNFKFIDQYGRKIESPSALALVKLEVSNANILTVTADGQTTNAGDKIIETEANVIAVKNSVVITTATDAGSGKLTAKLEKGGSIISTVDVNISVTEGVPSTLTFEIADIANLPALVADGGIDGNDEYARPIVITAKDASGTTYAIPDARIMSVSTTDTDLIRLSAATVDGAVKAQDGYYVVAAQDEATAFGANDPATKTATIKVVISTDNGAKEVTKQVTVAKEDPKVVKVVFADMDLTADNPYALDKDAKEIAEISGTVAEVTDAKLFIFEVDQYGVYTKVTPASLKVVSVDKFNGTTVAYDSAVGADQNTLDFVAGDIKADKTVYVMHQAANGVYATFTIKASNGSL